MASAIRRRCFGVESVIDEIADEMGWDPVAFRLKNIKRTGDPIARGGAGEEDGRLVTQVLDRASSEGAAKFGWSSAGKRPAATASGPMVRGIGVALTERGGGGGQGAARVKVEPAMAR